MSWNHHHTDGEFDREMLPADLDDLHQRLLRDGTQWRGALAPAEQLTERVTATLVAAPLPPHGDDAPHAGVATGRRGHVARAWDEAKGRNQMGLGRARGWLAAAAALLVVGLMAVLLFSLGPSRPGGHATATATATVGKISGHWQTVAHLSNELTAPIVAPSDPLVVYELQAPSDNGVAHGMRRTDDGGVSWHPLAVPQLPGQLLGAAIRVSPVEAHDVFLEAEFGVEQVNNTVNCPPATSVVTDVGNNAPLVTPLSNLAACPVLLYSTDGGDHWATSKLPVQSQLVYTNSSWPMTEIGVVQAQGNRLFAAMQPVAIGTSPIVVRLMVSVDQGATWQFADAALVSQAPAVCDVAAAPQGTTLFALTTDSTCFSADQTARAVWRSDDDGAHWNNLGAAPGSSATFAAVAMGDNGAQVIPYLQLQSAATDAATDLAASLDGGRTWHLAPTAGVPASLQFYQAAGTAGDGSLIAAMQPTIPPPHNPSSGATATPMGPRTSYALTLYAWKAGDVAWRQISPASQGIGVPGYVLVAPGSGAAPGSVWVVSLHGDFFSPGSTYDLHEYVLG